MGLSDQADFLRGALYGPLSEHVEKALRGMTGRAGINNHTHTGFVDDNGNGRTSVEEGHSHEIVNFKVRSANKHSHSS